MSAPFETVQALRPSRVAFNLSYEKKLTCDMGQLIPILAEEVVPGDTWKIGVEVVVRFMPMVAPVLHEINCFVHYFFVPFRLLDANWEAFITGGADGQDAHTMGTWIPTHGDVTNGNGVTVKDNGVGSLWDYFGFPVTDAGIIPAGAYPLAFPRRAYNLVFNQYYRDETQQAEVSLDAVLVKNRCWEKDYFTSALPWQQRGVAGAMPVAVAGSAVWAADVKPLFPDGTDNSYRVQAPGGGAATVNLASVLAGAAKDITISRTGATGLNANTISATATTFNVADLRLAFQIQKWQERNARGGARYIEFLMAHFGVAPRDERLQRAEYIGGTRMPVIVSEVLQTSETATTPQGTMAGHGMVVGRDFCASYRAQEYGIVIGIMSLMPKPAYGQGIERQWNSAARATRYDWYSPEWAHLSEQAVYRSELYASGDSGENTTVFGYQGRFNEMRTKQSKLCGLMRYEVTGTLGKYWQLARTFGSAPSLNETFLVCIPRKDFLAAPSQPTCIVNVANVVKAVRPLPIEADPGLIDHS